MAENRLPNGVGKKIVQALKKQAEIEIQPIPDNMDGNTLITETPNKAPEFYSSEISDNVSLDDEYNDFSLNNDEEIENINNSETNNFNSNFAANVNFDAATSNVFNDDDIFRNESELKSISQPTKVTYDVPANVAVLKRLIMQLPQGVTKQTGAQIIRQTMEALGISMNSVLKEAQQGQDSLTASAKSCLATIQEYQNAIKGLEKQVQDYKKQAIALNDLISLFVMTDRH